MAIKGVPNWIEGTAEEWGKEMRRFEKKITSIDGTLGRIMEEGPVGAAIRSHRDNVPDVDFYDDEIRKFHRAWIDLDVKERGYIWVHFKERGRIRDKIDRVDTKINDYYNTIRATLCHIAAEFHLYE